MQTASPSAYPHPAYAAPVLPPPVNYSQHGAPTMPQAYQYQWGPLPTPSTAGTQSTRQYQPWKQQQQQQPQQSLQVQPAALEPSLQHQAAPTPLFRVAKKHEILPPIQTTSTDSDQAVEAPAPNDDDEVDEMESSVTPSPIDKAPRKVKMGRPSGHGHVGIAAPEVGGKQVPLYVRRVRLSAHLRDAYARGEGDGPRSVLARPPMSYAALIGEALLLAEPPRQLLISEIFNRIADRYSYYAANPKLLYNGIRHAMTTADAFVKLPRQWGDQSGKARKWQIKPGCEDWFLNGKYRRGGPHAPKTNSGRGRTKTTKAQPTKQPKPAVKATAPESSTGYYESGGSSTLYYEPGGISTATEPSTLSTSGWKCITADSSSSYVSANLSGYGQGGVNSRYGSLSSSQVASPQANQRFASADVPASVTKDATTSSTPRQSSQSLRYQNQSPAPRPDTASERALASVTERSRDTTYRPADPWWVYSMAALDPAPKQKNTRRRNKEKKEYVPQWTVSTNPFPTGVEWLPMVWDPVKGSAAPGNPGSPPEWNRERSDSRSGCSEVSDEANKARDRAPRTTTLTDDSVSRSPTPPVMSPVISQAASGDLAPTSSPCPCDICARANAANDR